MKSSYPRRTARRAFPAELLSLFVMLVWPLGAADGTAQEIKPLTGGQTEQLEQGAEPPHVASELTYGQVLEQLSCSSDRTLAVKKFDPQWVRTLAERGEPIVYTRKNSNNFEYIGMPVGGICAGQLYLGGDGKLWCWDLFNTKTMSDVRGVSAHANPYRRSEPDTRAHHQLNQGFAIRMTADGGSVTRTLDRDGFKDIEFRGQYPIGFVTYSDSELPLQVRLEAFSPFIPLDLDNSVYPATILNYTITNKGEREVAGELFGWLENAVCIKSRQTMSGLLKNRVVSKPRLTMITFEADKPEPPAETPAEPRPEILFEDFEGDLSKWMAEGDAFEGHPKPNYHHQPLRGHQGRGLADSFRNAGDVKASAENSDAWTGSLTSRPFTIERKAIRFLIGGGSHAGQTCLNLVVEGKVVQSATGANSERLDSKVFNVSLLQGKKAHLEIVDSHSGAWGHVLVDQIVFTDEANVQAAPLGDLPDFGSMCLALLEEEANVKASASYKDRPGNNYSISNPLTLPSPPRGRRGSGSYFLDDPNASGKELANRTTAATESFGAAAPVGRLGRVFRLKPGQTASARFVLAWYFPNYHIDRLRTETGRWYGRRFDSAQAVSENIAARFNILVDQTRLWHQTWCDSTLPRWFLDRTMLNTSVLATNTCFLFRDGRFYGYEGVYHGHGTCTHVWGYVQAPGRLFPEVERRLREMVDYREGVAFDPQTGVIQHRSEHGGGVAVDGQSGTILRTYLAHQMSPNNAFLKRIYPSMKKAMNCLTEQYDSDRDGILTGGQHNTLDAKWHGKIPWLSLHYTAALRAAAAMADEMRDRPYARQCRELADRGRTYIENKLFNGEYFFHEVDPEHPESPGVFNGLEYSQLLGQSWAHQVGLGRILDHRKVTTHLESLWKYNFSTDVGPFREKYQNGRWYAMPGEGGIIACTWPYGGEQALTHGNQHFAGYLNECQPGYEWAATSLLMWQGMPYHALAHTRTMHDRYHGSKRNPWNEVEWGSHYSRSMASYGVFTAACGFEYHGPQGYLAFSPRITPDSFRAAFTTAEGWGAFSQQRRDKRQTVTIELKWGKLRLRTLAFDLPADTTARTVRLNAARQPLAARHLMRQNRVVITLAEPVTVQAGQSLFVEIGTGQ